MNNLKELKILYELIQEYDVEEDIDKLIIDLAFFLKDKLLLEKISIMLLSEKNIMEYRIKDDKYNIKKHNGKSAFPIKDGIEKIKNNLRYTFCFEGKKDLINMCVSFEIKGEKDNEEIERLKLLIKNMFLCFLKLYKAKKLSFHDEFTGLYNNRYLREYLKKESERALRYHTFFSIIFLDLDGLKKVNDNFGHLYGGKVLLEVGKILKNNTRASDIVGRFGGDEFLLIIFGATKKEAKTIAERIRERIKSFVFLKEDNLNLKITASMGIACFPDDAEDVEELISKADKAMYKVKKRGKDGVECYEEEE